MQRNHKIDFIKAIAIIYVVFIHSIAPIIDKYPIASPDWNILLIYRTIVSPSVPLFFMCSGVLLFDENKNITVESIFKKYLPRILIALFFWSAIYEVQNLYLLHNQPSVIKKTAIEKAIQNLIFFRHNHQMYYLHIMILYYLLTPIAKVFLDHAKISEIKLFLVIWAIFGICLPTFSRITFLKEYAGFTKYVYMPMGYAAVGYGILGHYISQKSKTKSINKASALLSVLAGFLLALIMTKRLSMEQNQVIITFWGGMSFSVLLISKGFFELVYSLDLKLFGLKFFEKISLASFSIFLTHDIFLKFAKFYSFNLNNFSMNILYSLPLFTFIVVLLSYILYLILKFIPIVNKYLI
ncbi:acyltransferase [Criibacterium bergeronii]|uniref:Acyltransferase n=1 Tax=Criibacterium bergeronii TaxID=1871336 RepID=A0A371IMY8_9FIRM|nr:acyltransferase family protein [Criibacterium bergeronii]MBS6063047.1 acyltransferase family protein [Peptostreptococcaceae bacterium]RDY21841.1 acyltransferase [Criibacterium bergeronii]